MIGLRRMRTAVERWFRRSAATGHGTGRAGGRHFALVAVLAVAERPDPIQPPPPIFDLLLAILFAWGGWKVWQKGRTWRSGALVLWLLALGGIYTFSRSF